MEEELKTTIDMECLKKKDRRYIEGMLSVGNSIDDYTKLYLSSIGSVPKSIRDMIEDVVKDYTEGLKADITIRCDEKMMQMILDYEEGF